MRPIKALNIDDPNQHASTIVAVDARIRAGLNALCGWLAARRKPHRTGSFQVLGLLHERNPWSFRDSLDLIERNSQYG
jgi:hypothetical protein